MSTPDTPLASQVAVVTGAGRGIGAAIAQGLVELGATSVVCGRTRERLAATARSITQIGGKAEVFVADVSSLPSVEALVQFVEKTFGRVDILVNNAGIGGFSSPSTSSLQRIGIRYSIPTYAVSITVSAVLRL